MVSVRWGLGWGETVGDRRLPAGRTNLSNLTPGLRRDDGEGTCRWEVCNFQNTAPTPTLPNLPLFPKEKAPDPPRPVLLSSNLPPPLNTPLPLPPPLNKICENATIVLGIFFESKLDMFRSTEDQDSSVFRAYDGELWAVDKSKWGFGVSGPEGSHVASSISKVMTTVLTLASTWKPSVDRHNSNYQFSILSWGRGLRLRPRFLG